MNVLRKRYPVRIALLFITLVFMVSCSLTKTAKETEVFDAEASLSKANDLIARGYHEEAREILDQIRAKDASQQYAVLAKLRTSDTYYEDEMYEEAAVEYESFLAVHQFHKYASYAQYKLAMSYFKRITTADVSYSMAEHALTEFEKLQKRFPRNPYLDVTENRMQICRRVLAEYEFYVGQFYFKKGSYAAAAGRFNGLLTKYPDSKLESETLFYLGLSYKNLGEREKAFSAFQSLIEKFPSNKLSSDAREYVASFDIEE